MENNIKLDKPKNFTINKKLEPPLYVFPHRQRDQFSVDMFHNYNLHFNNEIWEIKSSGVNIHMEPIYAEGRIMQSKVIFDPLSIEVYDCNVHPIGLTQLFRWINQINEVRMGGNLINYGELKRDVRLENVDNTHRSIMFYGSVIYDSYFNDIDNRFNIDPLIEAKMEFDYCELI